MDPLVVSKYVTDLAGAGAKKIEFEAVESEKRAAVEQLRNELTPELKDQLKKDMTFRLVDSKGKQQEKSIASQQEKAIDTFGSVKKGHGIAEEDWPRVQNAMQTIVEMTRKAIDKMKNLKHPDDKGKPVEQQRPVYDLSNPKQRTQFETLIELEVFTPLVREGILPETLVDDAYSEVQKLLNAAFEGYKGTLKESLEEERDKEAKELGKLHVEGGTFHAVKKKAFQAKQMFGYLKEQIEPSEETKAKMKIGYELAKTAYKTKKAIKSITNMIPETPGAMPKGVMKQDRFLHPEKYTNQLNEERTANIKGVTDGDVLRMELDHQKQEDRTVKSVKKLGFLLGPLGFTDQDLEKVGKQIAAVKEIKDENWAFYTKSSIDLLKQSLEGGLAIGGSSAKIDELGEVKEKLLKEQIAIALFQEQAEEAAVDAIETVDAAITAGVKKVAGGDAGDMFDGLFSDEVEESSVEAAAGKPDVDKIIQMFGDGIKSTFITASPSVLEPLFSQFKDAGAAAASAFESAASKGLTNDAVKEDPKKAFDILGTAAFAAVTSSITPLKATLEDPLMLKAMAAKSILDEEEEQLESLEKSAEELKEFERSLTLIDEGGVSDAEQRSIETLIAKLQRDKEIVKLVNTLGSTLTGLAGTSTNIAAWATEQLTDVVSGQVGSALKAAKLIIKLAVNLKESVDRWRLFYKFKTDLERSKKAVSSLSSTIQGFFNNKKEQCTFHEMENALTCVQIAAAIVGTVPEPITMAVGKAMSAVAAAAESALKVSQMIYNEAKLAEGWAVTKEALNSPRDRVLGLKALRLNPTLGMHAIAWAALEKSPPDPVARMMLDSLGINEQTIAAGATEKKVRDYLTELLDEDRQFTDPAKINVDWAPSDHQLSVKSFFVVVSRGQREAVPKLRPGDEKAVVEALKATDRHKIEELTKTAQAGEILPDDAVTLEKEAEALWAALNAYTPTSTDGGTHIEMSNIADAYLKLATDHRTKIKEITLLSATVSNPSRAFNTLNDLLDGFEGWFGKKGEGEPTVTEENKEDVRKATASAVRQLQEMREVRPFAKDKILQAKMNELGVLLDRSERWLDGDAPKVVTRPRSSRREKTAPMGTGT